MNARILVAISTDDFEAPVQSLMEHKVASFQEREKEEIAVILDDCGQICKTYKVPFQTIQVQSELITDGILGTVVNLRIEKPVMGVAATSSYSRECAWQQTEKTERFCKFSLPCASAGGSSSQSPSIHHGFLPSGAMCRCKQLTKDLIQIEANLRHTKIRLDDALNELDNASTQLTLFVSQAKKWYLKANEMEDKLVCLENSQNMYKKLSNRLQKKLHRLAKQQQSFDFHMLPCEYSLLDLEKATNYFDRSLRVGKGGYGKIYRGFLNHTDVAIKMLRTSSVQGPLEFKNEVDILSKLRHPNIVTLLGICTKSRGLIYEYLPNGSLKDRLKCKDNTPPLPWQTRIQIATELCSALNFLHSRKPKSIIHGDITPKNVLLDGDFVSKLSGFGYCRDISNNEVNFQMARKTDVYSFGVILLCLLTAKSPSRIVKKVHSTLENDDLYNILDHSAGQWPLDRAIQLAQMALRCCHAFPDERPDLASEVWMVFKPRHDPSQSLSTPLRRLRLSEDQIPSYFICPILQEIMQDPHFAADGFTYEGNAIKAWFDGGHDTSPMTNLRLTNCHLTPNRALHSAIEEWQQKHRYGFAAPVHSLTEQEVASFREREKQEIAAILEDCGQICTTHKENGNTNVKKGQLCPPQCSKLLSHLVCMQQSPTLYKLQQTKKELKELTEKVLTESMKRQAAEKEASEANLKLQAAENDLIKMEADLRNTKTRLDDASDELDKASIQLASFGSQTKKWYLKATEMENKLISSENLQDMYKKLSNRLQEKLNLFARGQHSLDFLILSCEYSLSDLEEATNCFDSSLKVGEGGYGNIYRGFLNHTDVAIKMLHTNNLQGPLEFKQEVDILSKLRHPNIVTLLGICTKSRGLIYEYLPNGSLEDRLNCKDNTPPLPWQTRIQIAIELCSVLNFLHSRKPNSIVHGDINPKNVLLDGNFVSKLSGFGYRSAVSSNEVDFQMARKTDVYSFGVILLCLLTAESPSGIVEKVKSTLENDDLYNILDQSAGQWPFVRATQLARMALRCCHALPDNRPDLASEVWMVLKPSNDPSQSLSPPIRLIKEGQIPSYFNCPIFQEIMQDPQFAADGFTYERAAIKAWFDSGHDTSPMTNLKLKNCRLTPNRALRSAIGEWQQKHRCV
ncbi:hypothetical protein KSS87_001929 [Heliosperma pusillum]|nr:hypothetical protein KSS87_001929 [Heliosperma pusillum]